MDPSYRAAIASDLAALRALDKECFPAGRDDLEPAPEGELERGLESGSILVALVQQQVVGFLQYENFPQAIELLTLAITADFRDSGVGTNLMQKFLNFLKDSKIQRIYCFTSPSNLAMQKLLAKFGFRNSGLVENHYGSGKHRLRFELELQN